MAETIHLLTADPDLQVTVTDFADYTEYFPSDLIRSLSLIRKLDEAYQESADLLHNLTKTYGSLPTLPEDQRPNAQELREQISAALKRALKCRESSYGEAERLSSLTDNLASRLHSIRQKLEAQPRPPSRENTPPPSRTRKTDFDRTPRSKLLHDAEIKKTTARSGRSGRFSTRRLIIPGEVLPPRDPNSPSPSLHSESEVERSSPVRAPPKIIKLDKEKTPRPPKPEKEKIPRPPKQPKIRPPGMVGTNAHSMKVGISVSNAMAQLAPPPEDPVRGSQHAPWLRLSEWELLRIRKSMKKNADWMPSDIMVKRILEKESRGKKHYDEAKRAAREMGEEFLDEQPQAFVRPVVLQSQSSEIIRTADEDEKVAESGLKLNVGSKKKKAEQKAEDDMQAGLANILTDPSVPESTEPIADEIVAASAEKAHIKNSKKRKRELEMAVAADEAAPEAEMQQPKAGKLIKLKPPAPATAAGWPTTNLESERSTRQASIPRRSISQQPEALAVVAAVTEDHSTEKAKSGRKRGHKSAIDTVPAASQDAEDPIEPAKSGLQPSTASRPRSRGTIKLHLKAASAEPEKPRISLRRTSDVGPDHKAKARTIQQNTETAASRRGKRAAPGLITSHPEESGARTSHGGRKNKKGSGPKPEDEVKAKEEIAPEEVDPGVEVYCYCRDVSHGQMIACENAECELEWFHVDCAGLTELAKTTRLARHTWYCANCRGSFKCNQQTGIVQK